MKTPARNAEKKKPLNKFAVFAAVLALAALLYTAAANVIVISSASEYIISAEQAYVGEDFDCIIVLGARVYGDGSLSSVLSERVDMGVSLYKRGVSKRLLLSGDHSSDDYDEVGAMKARALELGVPESDIFTDHAGFDTYDTMYRAKEIFKAERVLIVTQKFHISRAVFIARSLGLDAYGTASDVDYRYTNIKTEAREIIARAKYVLDAIFKPNPKFLGEAIPIWGEASLSDG